MILTIYKRSRAKDKYNLHSFPKSLEDAMKVSKSLKERAIKLGYKEADVVIQGFDINPDNIPQELDEKEIKPEKLLVN